MLSFFNPLLVISVAIQASKFKCNEAVSDSFYFGDSGLGFLMQTVFSFDLGVIVRWQVFERAALGGGIVNVTEQISGCERLLKDFAGLDAQREVFDLRNRANPTFAIRQDFGFPSLWLRCFSQKVSTTAAVPRISGGGWAGRTKPSWSRRSWWSFSGLVWRLM